MQDNSINHKEEVQDGGFITQKIPRILIEVLLPAIDAEKQSVKEVLKELEKQLNSSKNVSRNVRVFYNLRKENQSEEEQKEWLIKNSNCFYYVFVPSDLRIGKEWVKTVVDNVLKLIESSKKLKKMGVILKKQDLPNPDSCESTSNSPKIDNSNSSAEKTKELDPSLKEDSQSLNKKENTTKVKKTPKNSEIANKSDKKVSISSSSKKRKKE